MFEAYTVAVKISVIDSFSKGILAASAAFRTLDLQVAGLNERLGTFRRLSLGAGGVFAGLGIGLAIPMVDAISKAAQLQKQMIAIQIATAGTTEQMNQMRFAIEKASSTTIFSANQVADITKLIATSNTFTPSQLTSVIPQYAKFADVMYLLKGTPYQTSVPEAVRLAHTAQLYSPAALSTYLDTLVKASIVTSGSITELGHALKYSQGTAQTALGVDPQTMVLLTALLNRMGFSGSRGGTNLIDAMIRTIPGVFGSGLLRGKSLEALTNMGMVDPHGHSLFFTNGKFDALKWMQGLSAYVAREMASHPEAIARQDILTNFQHAFGAQGRRVASLLAGPTAIPQFLLMQEQFSKLASAGKMQDIFVKQSVLQQYITAQTNLNTAMMEFGYQLLPTAASALHKVNSILGTTIHWMQQNQEQVQKLAKAFVVLAGALIAIGTLGLLAAAIASLLTPIGLVVTAIAGLVAGFTYLYMKFDKFRDFIHRGDVSNRGAEMWHPFGWGQGVTPSKHESSIGQNEQTVAQAHTSATAQQAHVYLDKRRVGSVLFGTSMDSFFFGEGLNNMSRFNTAMSPMTPASPHAFS